jgi:hypothetical protein
MNGGDALAQTYHDKKPGLPTRFPSAARPFSNQKIRHFFTPYEGFSFFGGKISLILEVCAEGFANEIR